MQVTSSFSLSARFEIDSFGYSNITINQIFIYRITCVKKISQYIFEILSMENFFQCNFSSYNFIIYLGIIFYLCSIIFHKGTTYMYNKCFLVVFSLRNFQAFLRTRHHIARLQCSEEIRRKKAEGGTVSFLFLAR